MAAEVCADTFLINLLGNLICTFRFKIRTNVTAVYGPNIFTKTFLYTPGTGVDVTHTNYGFFLIFDPSPGPPPDTDFPAGVTLAGSLDDEPDLTGNLTEAKEAVLTVMVTIDENQYLGGQLSIGVTAGFNPGVD